MSCGMASPKISKTVGATSVILRALDSTRTASAPGRSPQDHAVLRVVRPVRAGVIFERVQFSAADRADGPPVEIAEIDDQIRGHATHFFVEFLGPVNLRADVTPVFIRDRFQPCDKLVAHLLVILRGDRSFRFAARRH